MAIAMLASSIAPSAFAVPDVLHAQLKALELRAGGRIGLAVLDTRSNRRIAYREGERFAMCSTFKLLLAAAVLHRVDQRRETLDRRIAISKADLLPVSPGTEPHVGGSLDVASLCEAAMIYSDNAAANLLLRSVGGPSGVTAFARALGDPVTRLDHSETDLNNVAPGEVHDTTTPAAMLGDLQALLIGDALSPASRQRLTGWMVANRTGDARLRAGAPKAWRVGDKTGAWLPKGGVNDLAAFWPPGRKPILIAAYTYGAEGDMALRSAPLAEIGRLVAAWAEAV